MKTVAQITYLAHVGSYVPATKATISVVDAIYTRMHCPESMYLSKSSFLIEMQQMSNVIMNSSSKSLIFVDELGTKSINSHYHYIKVISLNRSRNNWKWWEITFDCQPPSFGQTRPEVAHCFRYHSLHRRLWPYGQCRLDSNENIWNDSISPRRSFVIFQSHWWQMLDPLCQRLCRFTPLHETVGNVCC